MDNRKSEGNAEKVSNSAGIGDICFSTCTTGTMPSRCLDAVLRQYYEPPRGGGACSLSSWPASEMLAVSTANPPFAGRVQNGQTALPDRGNPGQQAVCFGVRAMDFRLMHEKCTECERTTCVFRNEPCLGCNGTGRRNGGIHRTCNGLGYLVICGK